MDSPQYTEAERPTCTLTEYEKDTRRRFVKEYLKDYDAFKACIRINYSAPFASDFSKRFMQEPFVLNLISQAECGADETGEIDEEQQKRKILSALWREANSSYSPAAARVAALAKLTSIFGMDAPSKSHITTEGGGTFVVPGIMNENQWTEVAAKQQAELQKPQSPAQLKAV